jgi:integrator complex subunit 5
MINLFSGSGTGSEQSPFQPVSLDSITTVSLLLVDLISPDIMYNGLPWPEEEFCKVLKVFVSL